MICKTTRRNLLFAASENEVNLHELRRANGKPTDILDMDKVHAWRFRITPKTYTRIGPRGGRHTEVVKYGRRAVPRPWDKGEPRRLTNAVCWHGHRDFMESVYARDKDAVFRTAVATYKGKEDFEAKFEDTFYQNAGSIMMPCYRGTTCDCGDGPLDHSHKAWAERRR